MNNTEKLALDWLQKKYPKLTFEYNHSRTPDFYGSDNSAFEIKTLMFNSVIIGNMQEPLLERLNPTILVFRIGEFEPKFVFKYKDFPKELHKVVSKSAKTKGEKKK
jgi:hypothetical protein